MNKDIRYFNDHGYNVELEKLSRQLISFRELLRLIREIDPECDNLDSLFKVMNAKTGFLNSKMSFDAMNMSAEYNQLLALQAASKDIDVQTLNGKTLEFHEGFLEHLKTMHTTYYSPTQLKSLKAINEALETFNKLPFEHRKLIASNSSFELVKNPFFDRQFN